MQHKLVITDKNVEIGDGKVLTGSSSYPLYIGKMLKSDELKDVKV